MFGSGCEAFDGNAGEGSSVSMGQNICVWQINAAAATNALGFGEEDDRRGTGVLPDKTPVPATV